MEVQYYIEWPEPIFHRFYGVLEIPTKKFTVRKGMIYSPGFGWEIVKEISLNGLWEYKGEVPECIAINPHNTMSIFNFRISTMHTKKPIEALGIIRGTIGITVSVLELK
jgi:hypothetical protein